MLRKKKTYFGMKVTCILDSHIGYFYREKCGCNQLLIFLEDFQMMPESFLLDLSEYKFTDVTEMFILKNQNPKLSIFDDS